MIRKLCLMVLGLSLCATLCNAQVLDRVSLPTPPLPGNEQQFLARYGAHDSSAVLITDWYRRRRRSGRFLAFGTLATAAGVLLITTSSLSSGPTGLLSEVRTGSLVMVGAAAVGGVALLSRARLSRRRLERQLDHLDSIPPEQWRRMFYRYR